MGLGDSLGFKGSIATQLLRDQHAETVRLAEGFIGNEVKVTDFLGHVDYSIMVHFPLEDNFLIPVFRPFLKKYLDFEEPIRVITGEHMIIRKERQDLIGRGANEYDEALELTADQIAGKSLLIAKTLLQHVFKEENGLFQLVDSYLPDHEKQDLSKKLKEQLPLLEAGLKR
ncbi:MAG: hemerythrin domain-containing protein [Thermoplasmataceae archaeon]